MSKIGQITELKFREFVLDIINKECDKTRVSTSPTGLFYLDVLIHQKKVFDLDGPLAIQIEFFKGNYYSFTFEQSLEKRILYVKKELEKDNLVKRAIIITNLSNNIIDDYVTNNTIPMGITIWGYEQLKFFIKKYNILDIDEELFVNLIDEEIASLITNPDKREKQIKYQNHKYLLQLKEVLTEGELSLFLGAGVSMSANLPSWNELVERIYFESLLSKGVSIKNITDHSREYWKFTEDLTKTNLIIRTRYAKILLGDKFTKIVNEWLYKNSDKTSDLIKTIAKLCVNEDGTLKRKVFAIVTYNFDDLLEQNITSANYTTIWKDEQRSKPGCLPIYHVHGFLPQNNYEEHSSLVFSEDDYHEQFINIYSWSNIVQLNLFREKSCIFIGSSLSDPNIRRLLDVCRIDSLRKHYIILTRLYTESNVSSLLEKSLEVKSVLDNLPDGSFLRNNYQYLTMSKEELIEIMLTEEMLIEKNMNELGINVVWLDSYKEIPGFISLLDNMSDSALVERSPLKYIAADIRI